MANTLASIFPRPRLVTPCEGAYHLGGTLNLTMPSHWRVAAVPETAQLGSVISSQPMGETKVMVVQGNVPASNSTEAYRLLVRAEGISVIADSAAGARYGLRTVLKLIVDGKIPCCDIQDWPSVSYRGVQIDLGRVIERPETIERLIPIYASFNYNYLQLYVENALVFPSHPKLARKYAWTIEQAMKIADLANRYGIAVIPAIQALGHCHWLTSHTDYTDLDEKRAEGGSGVLCPSQSRTKSVLEALIRDVAPIATSGMIHLGMDESPVLGQCELCKPIRQEIGEGGLYAMHANNLARMAKNVGLRPAVWGDMFHYFPECVEMIDKDIVIFDWYYYTFDENPRIDIFDNQPYDSVGHYQEHGISSWGCPSSFYTAMMPYCLPSESIDNCRSWTRYMMSKGEKGVMVTQWELAPSNIDLVLPVEGAMAAFLWGDELTTPSSELLERSCDALFDQPQLAPLLEEIGKHRFHGHCTRRWLYAPSIAEMVTFDGMESDLTQAKRFDEVANEIGELSGSSSNPDMVQAFIPASKWLAYQYRKRAYVNEAALSVSDGDYTRVVGLLEFLREEAYELSVAWKNDWLRNRYDGDHIPLTSRLNDEVSMFVSEIDALKKALEGHPYTGSLAKPVLAVHLVDTYGSCCMVSVEVSDDGKVFKDLDSAWVLQFDSEAMGGRHAAEMNYTFPLDDIRLARFVRIKAKGTGRYSLRSVALHQGRQEYKPIAVEACGKVQGAELILSGGLATMGCPDSKQLFLEQMAAGDSGSAFSHEHGAITVEIGGII